MNDHVLDAKKKPSLLGAPGISFMALLVLWWLLLIVFNAFPGIDLSIAHAFFTSLPCGASEPAARVCGEFAYAKVPFFIGLRTILFYLPYAAVIVLLLIPLMSWRRLGAKWRTPIVDLSMAALVSLAIGCGIIVNLFLKEYSGRPRPRDTDLFGGALDFVQAGSFAGKCVRNCSFISGEASSAGWLFCLALLLPPRLRLPLGIPLAAISILMPISRVITGAHYFSDAVLGWLSSLVVFAGAITLFEVLGSRLLKR